MACVNKQTKNVSSHHATIPAAVQNMVDVSRVIVKVQYVTGTLNTYYGCSDSELYRVI
jgi:hypothetical protein